ncbi:hypothetical protein [Nonomuraea zeae]|uniref:Cysteine dioxygenase n=1 Tax=Nonomuraea zeae TaxID=1642303 RepID=A0A5S4GBZ4_9ACTN|nr:hypothetical protein [Nonomuraea zeae]TMR30546.1 hypothetical protein ETD85_28645 [Nonomuraea zeae]
MDDLVRRLPALVAAPARQQRAALRELARPDRLARLLEGLAADESAAAQIAPDSYRHPLGFDKYVLWCRHPAGRLRLHVWWPEDERGREHVHNHRFAFSSAVVAGQVRSTLFAASGRGRPHTRYIDSTPLQAEGWLLEREDTVTVATSATLEVAAGTAYSQAASTFHHVRVGAGLTVTMFLEGAVTRSYSEVLLRPGQRPPDRTPRSPFTTGELCERLAALSETLRERRRIDLNQS